MEITITISNMLCIAFHLLADSQINKNKLLFFWFFFVVCASVYCVIIKMKLWILSCNVQRDIPFSVTHSSLSFLLFVWLYVHASHSRKKNGEQLSPLCNHCCTKVSYFTQPIAENENENERYYPNNCSTIISRATAIIIVMCLDESSLLLPYMFGIMNTPKWHRCSEKSAFFPVTLFGVSCHCSFLTHIGVGLLHFFHIYLSARWFRIEINGSIWAIFPRYHLSCISDSFIWHLK